MSTRKMDSYWEKKVERYVEGKSQVGSASDVATILAAMRQGMKLSVPEETHPEPNYLEKRAKLIAQEKALLTPASNKLRVLASLVPDEVLYNQNDYRHKRYLAALMFVDVSGFTQLCEFYTTKIEDGASKMSSVLNKYIGSMVQEIVMQHGDILKFSGDAFIAMWKMTPKITLTQAVQMAIECGLTIQRNYGAMETDVGVVLKVKVAISAGEATFSLIGDDNSSYWVIVGQPVWDVKAAESVSKAGDVVVTDSAWRYINENQYVTAKLLDGSFYRITAISANWKNIAISDELLPENVEEYHSSGRTISKTLNTDFYAQSIEKIVQMYAETSFQATRPSVNYVMKNKNQNDFVKFVHGIIFQCVDTEGRVDSLTEMRYVIVVFINIICNMSDDNILINIADQVYKVVSRVVPKFQGILDKLTLFDKDLVCLVVFGWRGLKHEYSCQQALSCAVALRRQLTHIEHVYHVSIGVTAGFVYCGVVGHSMRREASVIGMCVNKGARLMVAYLDKITCDKEVFLQSQLASHNFKHLIHKDLKGFKNVGPVYEYSEQPDSAINLTTPLIGRDDDLRIFDKWLNNIMGNYRSTKKRKNILVIVGQLRVGKTRFLEEIMKRIPDKCVIIKPYIDKYDADDYGVLRKLLIEMARHVVGNTEPEYEVIKTILSRTVREKYWHLLNPILGTNFPSANKSTVYPEIMKKKHFQTIFIAFCKELTKTLFVLLIDRCGVIAKPSMQLIFVMLENLPIIGIMSIHLALMETSEMFNEQIKKPHVEIITLEGVDRLYHATIISRLMKVDAISAELEKIVQVFSEGYVSWIERFIRIMVHSKQLRIAVMNRREVLSMGAIMSMVNGVPLHTTDILAEMNPENRGWFSGWEIFKTSFRVTDAGSRLSDASTTLRVAVLNPDYKFEDMQIEVPSYVSFLKMYDNMPGIERLVLKCSSAMGEIFHVTLLSQVLRNEYEASVFEGIVRLIETGVFELINYNFNRRISKGFGDIVVTQSDDILNIMSMKNTYIHFKNPMFYKYAYGLLMENQKKHYHNIAISVLRNTMRKCDVCGSGRFRMLLGTRRRDDFEENEAIRKRAREYFKNGGFHFKHFQLREEEDDAKMQISFRRMRHYTAMALGKRSVMEMKYLADCKCEKLLSTMYTQIIRHCKRSNRVNTLLEAYMEYTTLKLVFSDINEAIVIIKEAEDFVKGPKFKIPDNFESIVVWQKNFINGRISSKKGRIMYEFGNMFEAEKCLMKAMELFEYPFPTNTYAIHLKIFNEKFTQSRLLRQNPIMHVGKPNELEGMINSIIAETLSYLFDYFVAMGRWNEARLAALWSFNMVMRSNSDFQYLCIATANMLFIEQQMLNWDFCIRLEEMSSDMCANRIFNFDITDVNAYIQLITSILSFRLLYGDVPAGISIGHKLLPILSFLKVSYKLMYALTSLGEVLLMRKMFDMVLPFYNELKSVLPLQDLICNTLYFSGVVNLFIETHYWIEPYIVCYEFYLSHKDRILTHKHSDPGWYLVMGLALCDIRSRRWERIAEWKGAFKKFATEYCTLCQSPSLLQRFVEAQLLLLVLQMEEKNYLRCMRIRHYITLGMEMLEKMIKYYKSYEDLLLLVKAYFYHIEGNNEKMLQHLNKSIDFFKDKGFLLLRDMCEYLIKKFNEYHKNGAIYFWTGINYEEEIASIKGESSTVGLFSDIEGEL